MMKGLLAQKTGPLSRGALLSFSIGVLGIALGFFMQVVLARALETGDYGRFQFVIAWYHILLIPALLGADLLLMKYVPSKKQSKKLLPVVLAISWRWTAILSLSLAALMFVVSLLAAFSGVWGSLAISLGFLLLCAARYLSGYFIANKHLVMGKAPLSIVRPSVVIALVLPFLLTTKTLSLAVAFSMLCIALLAVIAMHFLFEQSRHLVGEISSTLSSARVSRARQRVFLRLGLSLSMISSVYVIMAEADKVLLGLLATAWELAWYSAASHYAMFLYFGFNAINLIAGPLLAEKYRGQRNLELQSLLQRIGVLNLIFIIPASLLLFVYAEQLLLVFGENFDAAALALRILAVAFVVDVLSGPTGYFLSISGEQSAGLRILLIGLAVNLFLTPLFILAFGMNGAATATALAVVSRSVLAARYVRKQFGVDPTALAMIRRTLSQSKDSS